MNQRYATILSIAISVTIGNVLSQAVPAKLPDWINFSPDEWQTITPQQAGLNVQKFNDFIAF